MVEPEHIIPEEARSSSVPVPESSSAESHHAFIFSNMELRSALEELEDVYLKRARGLRATDGESMEKRMERAYAIAKERLMKFLPLDSGERPPHGGERSPEVEN